MGASQSAIPLINCGPESGLLNGPGKVCNRQGTRRHAIKELNIQIFSTVLDKEFAAAGPTRKCNTTKLMLPLLFLRRQSAFLSSWL